MKHSKFCLCCPWSVAASWSSHRVGSALLPWYNSRYASKSHDWIWWLFRNNSGYCPYVIAWCLICKTNPRLLCWEAMCAPSAHSRMEEMDSWLWNLLLSLLEIERNHCCSKCSFSRAWGNEPSCWKTWHQSSFQLLTSDVAGVFLTIYWQIDRSCLSPPFICSWITRPFSQMSTLLTSVLLLLICSQHGKNLLSSLFEMMSFPWKAREVEWKNVYISI